MTDWITDRLPTEADADRDGEVRVCNSPRLSPEDRLYVEWNRVTPGWPWRRTQYWTPPTPAPEPPPAAPEPEQKAEEVAPKTDDWILDRPPSDSDADPKQNVIVSTNIYPDSGALMHWSRAAQGYLPWRHTLLWVPPKPEPEPPAPVIVTPEPEPEKATRGFLEFTRTEYEDSFVYTAVATDYTAWVFDARNTTNWRWRQIPHLPQPGEE